jgi:hypothetical protein
MLYMYVRIYVGRHGCYRTPQKGASEKEVIELYEQKVTVGLGGFASGLCGAGALWMRDK